MNTRFLTEVTTTFNPFSPRAKHARIFRAFLPPTARQSGMKVNTKLLPRSSPQPSALALKFSKCMLSLCGGMTWLTWTIEDGKEMTLDVEKLGIKGVVEEVNRHSRILDRKEALSGN